MKRIIALSIVSIGLVGCTDSARQPVVNSNSAVVTQTPANTLTVAAHSGEPKPGQTPPPATTGAKSKWTQSGEAIDTAAFDAEIAKAEKAVKANANDEAAKKALAEAYYKRGFALTEVRQYAAALGDYRRVLKYDPANQDAEKWIKQIVGIYQSLNKQYPPEGEEPPALPFKQKS